MSIYKYGLKALSAENSDKAIVKESISIVDKFIAKIKPDELKDLFYIGTEYRIFMVSIVLRYLTKLHQERELRLPPGTRPIDKCPSLFSWDSVPPSSAPEILMRMKTAEAWSEMATNYLVHIMQCGRMVRYTRHKKLKHAPYVSIWN